MYIEKKNRCIYIYFFKFPTHTNLLWQFKLLGANLSIKTSLHIIITGKGPLHTTKCKQLKTLFHPKIYNWVSTSLYGKEWAFFDAPAIFSCEALLDKYRAGTLCKFLLILLPRTQLNPILPQFLHKVPTLYKFLVLYLTLGTTQP